MKGYTIELFTDPLAILFLNAHTSGGEELLTHE